jgi:hypothetical protein
MAETADILRELHRLRRHEKDLRDQIERLPKMLKAYEGKATLQDKTLKQAQDDLKKLKVAVHEKEVSLKTAHQQVVKYEKQRNEAAGKKEYDALGEEMTRAKEQCQKLEDEIFAGLGEIDDKTAQLPEVEKSLKQAKHEVANFETIRKTRHAELTALLDKVRQDIKETEEIRALYDRQVGMRGADAMSAVDNRICTACYTGITAQMHNELLQGQFVTCKSCGRILYLREAAAAAP